MYEKSIEFADTMDLNSFKWFENLRFDRRLLPHGWQAVACSVETLTTANTSNVSNLLSLIGTTFIDELG